MGKMQDPKEEDVEAYLLNRVVPGIDLGGELFDVILKLQQPRLVLSLRGVQSPSQQMLLLL